ncbi:hypothetical protein CERSUDRAFT_160824 [Gelatoporia subvermispora B]|uniref:BTB domain-containing protein n=1 Tax=Ceriporiopsis subvermispora (strain B) TaxID=914234 RepID=M2PC44_CERS8|nr:hypothetical protein CERSUDRAFT_160824 [Gelatoporia subvermispora B]
MYSSLSSEGVTPVKIKNHPVYFLTGGDVHFQVKNYRFRIHRYFFERESAFWRERLASPTSAGQSPKGSLDNPFILEDVHPDDFSRFLWVFYNPQYSIYDATVEDWTAVLKLAFDWRFQEVKKLVTRELEKFALDPVFKIELYQSYELDRKLLIPAFIQLCTRPEPIDVKEGRQLGIETALLVAQARERARSSRVATPTEFADTELASVIKDVFGIVEPAVSALSPLAGTSGCGAFTGVKSKTQDPVTPITASASMSAFNGSSNNPFGNVDALANGNGTNGSTATGSSTPSGGNPAATTGASDPEPCEKPNPSATSAPDSSTSSTTLGQSDLSPSNGTTHTGAGASESDAGKSGTFVAPASSERPGEAADGEAGDTDAGATGKPDNKTKKSHPNANKGNSRGGAKGPKP